MRIKYIALYAVLAVAFAAASLWVFLSRNRSAKAVRAKFRLGGLMLTISSLLAVSSCKIFQPDCYDVAQPEAVVFALSDQAEVKAGDVIEFKIEDLLYNSYSYEITDSELTLLQGGELELTDNTASVTVGETAYSGLVNFVVYGKTDDERIYVGGKHFTLK